MRKRALRVGSMVVAIALAATLAGASTPGTKAFAYGSTKVIRQSGAPTDDQLINSPVGTTFVWHPEYPETSDLKETIVQKSVSGPDLIIETRFVGMNSGIYDDAPGEYDYADWYKAYPNPSTWPKNADIPMAPIIQKPAINHIGGANRFDTATAVAANAFSLNADTAVIVDGQQDHLIDALTAAPLARAYNAPILLARSSTDFGSDVVQDLQLLRIHQIVLVGAAASLKSHLPSGITLIDTVSGQDRYETAALLAQALAKKTGKQSFSHVYLAPGYEGHSVDALAAAPFAAYAKEPILLVAPDGSIPEGQTTAAATYNNQPTYVIGAAKNAHTNGNRWLLTGKNRFDTDAKVAEALGPKSFSGGGVVVVDGRDSHMADALVVGPATDLLTYVAQKPQPIVFVNGSSVPAETASYLKAHAKGVLYVTAIGGSGAVSENALRSIAALVK